MEVTGTVSKLRNPFPGSSSCGSRRLAEPLSSPLGVQKKIRSTFSRKTRNNCPLPASYPKRTGFLYHTGLRIPKLGTLQILLYCSPVWLSPACSTHCPHCATGAATPGRVRCCVLTHSGTSQHFQLSHSKINFPFHRKQRGSSGGVVTRLCSERCWFRFLAGEKIISPRESPHQISGHQRLHDFRLPPLCK